MTPDDKTSSRSSKSDSLLKLLDPSSLNLILVRHGQAGGNGTYDGFLGSALSKMGEQQAALVAKRIAPLPLDCIYASDLARAYQTAEAVCAMQPQTPFRHLPDIREISVFQVRGRRQARSPDEREALHQERERIKRFAAHLRSAHEAGQLIAIIAHNGVNGMLLSELTGLPYRRSVFSHSCHTGLTVANVSLAAPTVSLRLMGSTRHLPAKLVSDANVAVAEPKENTPSRPGPAHPFQMHFRALPTSPGIVPSLVRPFQPPVHAAAAVSYATS